MLVSRALLAHSKRSLAALVPYSSFTHGIEVNQEKELALVFNA